MYVCIRPNTSFSINCRLSSLFILKRCKRKILTDSRKNNLAYCCHKHIQFPPSRCLFYSMMRLIIHDKNANVIQNLLLPYFDVSTFLIFYCIALYKLNLKSSNIVKFKIIRHILDGLVEL